MTSATPAAVVFDLDGLLVNTEELYQHVGSELLGRRGHSFTPELLDRMMGRPPRVSLQIMIDAHALDATIEGLLVETDEIFAELLTTRLALMPGAAELLTALESRGVPKAVATSSRRSFAHDVLGRLGMLERFRFVLTCEDIREGKPHPEIYLLAARKLGIEPRTMLVLEDSQHGCRAAVASGAIAVAVPSGASLRHDFGGAAFVAQSLADPRIYDLLDRVA